MSYALRAKNKARFVERQIGLVLAESVRFELTVGRPITGFQDRLLKPLGQLSILETIPFLWEKNRYPKGYRFGGVRGI